MTATGISRIVGGDAGFNLRFHEIGGAIDFVLN